jgi:hypothetical protein
VDFFYTFLGRVLSSSVTILTGGEEMVTSIVRRTTVALLLLAAALVLAAPAAQAAPPTPEEDPFYDYAGATPLAEIAPGTVLKTRTLSYHVVGLPLPVKAVQLLYRSTSELGEPTVNVTSVLKPLLSLGTPQVVAYQSFYDSLNPADEPSYAISGGLTLGGAIPQVESALIGPELLAGRTVVVADTEGEQADFAVGPEYGINTLDSLRAALASPATGLATRRRRSAWSATPAARSPPSGRPSWRPPTPPKSTPSWSARRWVASSSTRPTTSTTSKAA